MHGHNVTHLIKKIILVPLEDIYGIIGEIQRGAVKVCGAKEVMSHIHSAIDKIMKIKQFAGN